MEETIKVIDGFPQYHITTDGKIYDKKIKNYLNYVKRGRNYYITLYNDENKTIFNVSTLISKHFIGEIGKNKKLHHVDGNRGNSSISNLCYIDSDLKKYVNEQKINININTEIVIIISTIQFLSITDAAKYIKVDRKNLKRILKTKGKIKGFTIKYTNPIENKPTKQIIVKENNLKDVKIAKINNTNYNIYSDGRVQNETTKKFLSQRLNDGYYSVSIVENGKKKIYSIHRLVATAFVTGKGDKLVVNHKDNNRTNNNYENLEWVTSSENSIHALKFYDRKTVEINQFHGDKLIATYSSIKEASEKTGAYSAHISKVSSTGRGKTFANGKKYTWKRVKELTRYPEPIDAKIIDGYPNYRITKNGEVYSILGKRYIKSRLTPQGYKTVFISKNKIKKLFLVHRLVASAYLTPIEGKTIVNHKDFNKANNNVENLEYVNLSENVRHTVENNRGNQINVTAMIPKYFESVKSASEFLKVDENLIREAAKNGTKINDKDIEIRKPIFYNPSNL